MKKNYGKRYKVRRKLSHREAKRHFNKHANTVHSLNVRSMPMRGGFRL